MISYISGNITIKTLTYVVIDIMGIGYHINISINTYEKIASLDQCRLLTHQVIKEDAHQLFGFFDEEERELFRHLIGISGVGPNTARMMLSSLSPEELKRAIIGGDISLIKSIKGIGPKGAQRIVIELQDVLKKTSTADMTIVFEKTKAVDEALSAMQTLGFQRAQAEKAVSTVLRNSKGSLTVEEILKQALKLI
jgi:Holliday junction DNA helicase RuvA